MADGIWSRVTSDLRRVLLGIPGIPAVKWEGRRFEPTPGIAWIRERLETGNTTTETLGYTGQSQEQAIYRLDLYWPATGSAFEAADMADRIRLTYWHGREVGSSGPDQIRGSVLASSRRSAVESDGWYMIPIRVEFFVRRFTRQEPAAA